MWKICSAILAAGCLSGACAAERLFVLAEDGFSEFLKQDFHKIALSKSAGSECKLSSVPEQGVVPVLQISTAESPECSESVLFALRGDLFYANTENPVNGLTAAEAGQILAGTFRRWSGSEVPLKHICFAGTEKKVFPVQQKDEPLRIIVPDPSLALQLTAEELTSAAVIPLVFAGSRCQGAKLLSVNGVFPTPETVMNGTYPCVKRYYLSVRKDAPAEIRALYEKLKSKEIKETLWKAGILPAVEMKK